MRNWLKVKRESKGYKQKDLADIVGVTRQHIGMIENTKANPSPEIAKKIGEVLEFDWTIFYE